MGCGGSVFVPEQDRAWNDHHNNSRYDNRQHNQHQDDTGLRDKDLYPPSDDTRNNQSNPSDLKPQDVIEEITGYNPGDTENNFLGFTDPDRGRGDETIPYFEQDDTDKHHTTSSDYQRTSVGMFEAQRDFRHSGEPFDDDERPRVDPGELWVDQDYPLDVAIRGPDRNGVEWMRPFEFCDSPVLFADGTTRFDIGQGTAGTCWFLSMVASISEKTELLRRVIPDGSYRINTNEYDGIFHARFWRFGQWDNVFIDDFLPIVYSDQLWGAKSSTDKNEMWVALLEKAFGRLYGAYNEVYGGQPGDAYLSLTGGVVERIDFDENKISPYKLFQRVKNALSSGSLVSCVVPEEYDGVMGLVGGHAYSLNGSTTVDFRGERVCLLRVRNPWGHTEWNGAWSDGSQEWQQLQAGTVENPVKDDGEFWMGLQDFLQYFSQLTICSLSPDVDDDGSGDCLNHVMCIYGEWKNETAAGFSNRTSNPRYVFTVSEDGVKSDGTVPIVVQVIQRTVHRKTDRFSIRCDLFQVSGEKLSSRPMYVLEMQGGEETNVYAPEIQTTHRHHVKPGQYAVIPSTIEAGQEKEFLVRVFSVSPLQDLREMSRNAIIMASEQEKVLEYNGETFNLDYCQTIFGEWRTGFNAGGQVSFRETFGNNPQFLITVPNTGNWEPVVFHVMQEQDEQKSPVGFRLFPYTGSSSLPVDTDYLYDQYDNCPPNTEGEQGKFVITWDLGVKYLLQSGTYIALIHMDQPTDEAKFALTINSQNDLNVVSYQAGE